jgi:hypothetical protein
MKRNAAFLSSSLLTAILLLIFSINGCDGIGGVTNSDAEPQPDLQMVATSRSIEFTDCIEATEMWHVETMRSMYEILSKYPLPNFEYDESETNLSTPVIEFEALSAQKQDALIVEMESFVADRLAVKPKPPRRILNPGWMSGYVVESDEHVILGDMVLSKTVYDPVLESLIYQSYNLDVPEQEGSRGLTISRVASWDSNVYRFCIADQNFIWNPTLIPWVCNPLDGTEVGRFIDMVEEWEDAANGEFSYERLPANEFFETIWPVSEFVMVGESADPSFDWGGYASVGPQMRAGCVYADYADPTLDEIWDDHVGLHEIGHNLGLNTNTTEMTDMTISTGAG